jgi:hypothetical protein
VASLTDVIENLIFRLGINGAPVANDDKGLLFVDNVHANQQGIGVEFKEISLYIAQISVFLRTI